tara:strand:- start:83 stop:334 length:252 start_codon:yes stop_codon:yes gene_type:complete
MKNFIAAMCLMIALPAFAAPRDYQATSKDNGTICAKVRVTIINNITSLKRFCRTEQQWNEAGYKISRRPILPMEQEGNEQLSN